MHFFEYDSQAAEYLHHKDGTRAYAERLLSSFLHKMSKKSAALRERRQSLLVEQASLQRYLADVVRHDPLNMRAWSQTRRRLMLLNTALVTLFVVAGGLHGAGFYALAQHYALPMWSVGVGALAATLLLSGCIVLVTAQWLQTWSSAPSGRSSQARRSRIGLMMWSVSCVLLLFTLTGVTLGEVRWIGRLWSFPLMQFGFILASLLLPLVGGLLAWHRAPFVHTHRISLVISGMHDRLMQIRTLLRSYDEEERTYFRTYCLSFWKKLHAFKTKRHASARNDGRAEYLQGHFAESFEHFAYEAAQRLGLQAAPVPKAASSAWSQQAPRRELRPSVPVGVRPPHVPVRHALYDRNIPVAAS